MRAKIRISSAYPLLTPKGYEFLGAKAGAIARHSRGKIMALSLKIATKKIDAYFFII